MTLDEIKSLFEQGTIEEIVQNMNKEQTDAFLKAIYTNAVNSYDEATGEKTGKYDPHFVQHSSYYTGYNLDSKMIYGESQSNYFYGNGVLADEMEQDMPSPHNISFTEAERIIREKIAKEKKDAKVESTNQEIFGVASNDDLVESSSNLNHYDPLLNPNEYTSRSR